MLKNKDSKMTIQLSGCTEGLNALRKLAEETCEGACLDKVQFNRVALAVDELFANIHEHGYAGQGGHIECEARWIESKKKQCKLEIVLRDFAPVVADVTACQGICPETLRDNPVSGGLGMNLIYAITEQFEHTPLVDGNRWRLVFDVQEGRNDESSN